MTPEELAAHQQALQVALASVNVTLDDALDTVEAIARNSKYQEAHIAARMQTIQTVLATPVVPPELSAEIAQTAAAADAVRAAQQGPPSTE